ncbi:bacteriocin resistance YdeI/OmpD-like protein [Edaphobacter aggregans]|uniref:Bacteriocin resistance YdeI/OmpD-like protein n=1 Tax=Edaphobacter aggregans TaxID=570835 RepID=A0A3R9P0G9_9BACT|nr:YdeI/OmpD-associated family protein [Edaphobacter aggregans]RSL19124.1 bacteriocin resistance YdeI/OmpD-like protein [Edaphobacter aggregans]
MPIHFSALIEVRGINPFVAVSSARAEALTPGWRKPLPVLVRINDKPQVPWRINLMPAGNGDFYLYLHETVRKASGTSVGDRVSVELSFDANYRSGPQHRMPQWFKQALDENPRALKNWTALVPNRKKEILRCFSQLKSLDARSRNLSKALRVLSGEGDRFMARDWRDGS